MCGIVGYIGDRDCADVLVNSLEKLEYRGYDSAGIAVLENGVIKVEKCKGRLENLRNKMAADGKPYGHVGIGHTRWATHGEPSDINSHPHGNKRVTIVHNGIIENYRQIKEFLISEGYSFVSETDTETVAKLLDYYYTGDPVDTIIKVLAEIKGSYALGIMFRDFPDRIFAVRKDSPLIVGKGEHENFIASDVPAIMQYTRDYYLLDTNDIAVLTKENIEFFNIHKERLEKKLNTADWDVDAAEKGGYEHFMLKEINEQPTAVKTTITPRITDSMPDFSAEGFDAAKLSSYNKIYIVACGTAMHAGLVAQALIKSILHMHIDVDMASEFMYSDPVIDEKTLVIAVSQSGETIDTLEAVKYAKNRGAKCLAIINVKGSSIARESDYVLYTNAGPEIAVASTKAYTTQLAVFYLIVARMAHSRGVFDDAQTQSFVRELQRTPEVMKKVLERRRDIHVVAKKVLGAKDLFMIGRGLDYSILLEGSLKLKEVSYIHSEAYASGELKHGPIALITQDTPVVATVTQEKLMSKELSNIKEVKSRGADVVVFIKESIVGDLAKEYEIFTLPDMQDEFMVLPASVALQLLAYYVSSDKGFDVDKPRNLAKVVTVE